MKCTRVFRQTELYQHIPVAVLDSVSGFYLSVVCRGGNQIFDVSGKSSHPHSVRTKQTVFQ